LAKFPPLQKTLQAFPNIRSRLTHPPSNFDTTSIKHPQNPLPYKPQNPKIPRNVVTVVRQGGGVPYYKKTRLSLKNAICSNVVTVVTKSYYYIIILINIYIYIGKIPYYVTTPYYISIKSVFHNLGEIVLSPLANGRHILYNFTTLYLFLRQLPQFP